MPVRSENEWLFCSDCCTGNGCTCGSGPVRRISEARDLLERCWETIAFRPQPYDAKAVEENRLLERIENFLAETKE